MSGSHLSYPPGSGGIVQSDVDAVGTDAGKPAAGTAGKLYFANDTGILYRDSGAAWVAVSPLQGAGLAPTADGSFGYDTTQKRLVAGGGTFAGVGAIPRVVSMQFSTTDLLDAAVITTTETAFATQLALPANFFIANKALRITVGFKLASTGGPTFAVRLRVQKSGPTNVNLWNGVAATVNSAVVHAAASFIIQGTAAVGASVNVITNQISTSADGPLNNRNTVSQPVAISTNVAQTVQVTLQFGAGTAGNTMTLQQFIAEELN